MATRTNVGGTVDLPSIGLIGTLRAEAKSWCILDILVQLIDIQGGGYEVRETDTSGKKVRTIEIVSDAEKALQTWMHHAFGVNIF